MNHADSGVGGVYDRYSYADEDRRIMETVAAHIVGIVEEAGDRVDNVAA